MKNNTWLWLAVLAVALVALITFLNAQFPGAMAEEGSAPRLVYLVILLAVVAGSGIIGHRVLLSDAIKMALTWVAVFAVLIIGYAYRADFAVMMGRVGPEVTPSRPAQEGTGMVALYRQDHGHFGVDALVNKARISFLVDTGASDVVLTYRDAERAGLEPWNLDYNRAYSTANGTAFGARVDIQKITIGDITLYNVKGSVMREGLSQSLLGLSFLDRLSSYQISGNKMILQR